MSGVDDARGAFDGILRRNGDRDFVDPLPQNSRNVVEELGDPEDRLMVILGTLRAALSIGMVYVVVFGIVIALMVFFWK